MLTQAWGLLASETKGFGLNFDILETNIINLAIVIGVLIYFGKGFLGSKLQERRQAIETAIKDAEARQKKAAASLAEQQQKLQMAKKEAERIKAEAQTNAEAAREAVLAQSAKDIERIKASAAQDLSSQQDKVMQELRRRVSAMAMEKVRSRLPDILNQDVQTKLVDQSISQLGE
ncbi:ATP synthase B/B' CF(0) superfamily [Synechococcus sp. PCC 7335]|uniref:F0F1 ATP synthase subunit B n=1 Tax=Synechococcus sp. (strain ATCC 29403 / PCC 7335) TaxID=91464 RepID=UPI00017ED906|nr:F0F1 ATP synthase subunit B [Synechococcus sp. PCC 7335]EDX87814.1 ATP synthase B/B' CF(0) superfamily [Synechococcus sp. PCC 7335]